MKSINVNDVALGAAMPYKSTMIDWIKTGEEENNSAIVNALTYNNPPAYLALYGCTSTVVGSTYTIAAGAIVEGGTISITNTTSTVTVAAGQVLIGTISTIYPEVGYADPVTFSDGTTHNVHAQTTIVWSSGASGSGDFNYSDLVFINDKWHNIGATGEPIFKGGTSQYAGTNNSVVAFRKDSRNLYLKGALRVPNTAGIATTIFTMPAGYFSTTENRGVQVLVQDLTTNDFSTIPLNIACASPNAGNVGLGASFTGFAGDALIYLDGLVFPIN
jgi:hypothetical protein